MLWTLFIENPTHIVQLDLGAGLSVARSPQTMSEVKASLLRFSS